MICCFTGHRDIPSARVREIIRLLDKEIENQIDRGVTVFRCGGALGFDTLAALRVLMHKNLGAKIELHLILPCKTQSDGWNCDSQDLYRRIISAADRVEYVSDEYTTWCMYARNRKLIDGSDVCIAYLSNRKGGTSYTCDYAAKSNVKVINIFDMLPNT